MPPEPLPWERKDYTFKDQRKYERGDALGSQSSGFSSALRSREQPHHAPRDLPRSSPRRPLTGQYRQAGGYHQVYPEDSHGHGNTPLRSVRFWSEDDGFRSSSIRYASSSRSSCGGSSRENRGMFRRSIYWDTGDFSRQHYQEPHAVTSQRPVAALISATCQSAKENNENIAGVGDGMGGDQRLDDLDHSLGTIPWKKWSRQVSSKTGGSELETSGSQVGVSVEKKTINRSSETSPNPAEEGAPRNKPRLGWGQGLAKYEKQKVEGSVEASVGISSGVLSDNSQKVTDISGCLSPSTPCSNIWTSSPGTEDKSCRRLVQIDFGLSQTSDVTGTTSTSLHEEVSTNLDSLEVNPTSLESLLVGLLQSEDALSGDSTRRHFVMTKLLQMKEVVASGLERIENKIDLLEKEYKLLMCDSKTESYQDSLKLANESAVQLSNQPLNDLPNESTNLKGQPMEFTVEENVSCTRFNKSDIVDESINIFHSETVPSEIGESPALAKKLSNCCMEKLIDEPSSIKDEGVKATELQKIVNSDGVGKLMIGPEDENKRHISDACTSDYRGNDEVVLGKTDFNLVTSFMDSNQTSKEHASKVFCTVRTNLLQSNLWAYVDLVSCRENDLKIKEKLAISKRQLRFKERALALKYRALNHLWKEDLRLLSMRKLRSKSSKHSESNRSLQNGPQKHRSTIRSRFTLSAGNLPMVPAAEIVNFTSKVVSNSQIKICRNNLRMPAMILDDSERRYSRFITQNGLIEDPPSFEKERAMISPWSQDEQEVFLEMLARYGKDFSKISSFLNHKTTADCIEFYYKNHKSENFKEVKKCLDLKKQQQYLPANTYLIGSGKNRKTSTFSVDMLDPETVVMAHSRSTARSEKYSGGRVSSVPSYLEGANSVTISGPERESMAANVLAGICGTLSSEAMSSSVSTSIDSAEKKYITINELRISEVTQNLNEDNASSDEDCRELDLADWTDEEKSKFIQALSMHGKDFTRISSVVRTRSREQCKIFFSKARKCLALDAIDQGCINEVFPVSVTHGGISDTDDASVAEMDSAICSTQSCSRLDVDVSQVVASSSYEGIAQAASTCVRIEIRKSDEHGKSIFGIPDLVVGEEKADNKPFFIVRDENLVSKEDSLQSDAHPEEGIACVSRSTETIQPSDAADRGTKVEANNDVISLGELIMKNKKIELVKECTVLEPKLLSDRMVHRIRKDIDSKPTLSTGFDSSNRKLININFIENANTRYSQDFSGSGASLISVNNINGCHRFTSDPNDHVLSCLQKKPATILLQENDRPSNSFLPDPSNICFGGSSNIPSETTLNFEDHGKKTKHLNVMKRDICQQYLLRDVPVTQVDVNMHILRGYPLPALKHEAMRGDTPAGESPSLRAMALKENAVALSDHFAVPDVHWNGNNASDLSDPAPGVLCPAKKENQAEMEEQRTGDVKLFGKILSHGSNIKSPKLAVASTDNCVTSGNDGNQVISNAGIGRVCLEDLPVTYGFWDGKRIQTGFSSLPETAAVWSKYQGSMTGASFYSVKDDIPGRNCVLTNFQQFFTDPKRTGNISELQKRNGVEIIPEFQQQRRVTPLSSSMVGRGILVSAEGVSDPVAALKMHYAARATAVSSDMEPWREDMGRR